MKGYNGSYLSDAMKNLGDMVEYAVCDLGFAPDEFFGYFISSGIAEKFGGGNPKYLVGMSGMELAETVLNTLHVPFESKAAVHTDLKGVEYWSGWIFAYYQWETGRRFADIVNDGLTLSAEAAGITLRMVQLYEQRQNDIRKAQVDTVLALSKALGCGIEDILDRDKKILAARERGDLGSPRSRYYEKQKINACLGRVPAIVGNGGIVFCLPQLIVLFGTVCQGRSALTEPL